MTILLRNGNLFTEKGAAERDLLVSGGKLFVFEPGKAPTADAERIIDLNNKYIIPGLTDVHVHFREPGFSYKETILTGSQAAAAGGYTCVLTMPNLDPVPSTLEGLKVQQDIIDRDACIHVIPYGTITQKQDGRSHLSDMEALAPYVCAFTDDGKGVQDRALMEEAMLRAKDLGKIIVAHCEDESLLGGTSIHDGRYAASIGHKGISSESEWRQVERDVELAAKTGCAYHVCHVSTKESVEIIRQGKKSGVDVTCETGPHYLVLNDSKLQDEGRFKMNPPIRDIRDQEALLQGLLDGTVDMVATDHAPHSAEEKSKGILHSAFGIVGLECAFPVLFSSLVRYKIMPMEKLLQVMAINPRKRFGLPGGILEDGAPADIAVIDTATRYTIDAASFRSMGHATPFDGREVTGKILMTICGGEIVYEEASL